jgi:hypothetical protein
VCLLLLLRIVDLRTCNIYHKTIVEVVCAHKEFFAVAVSDAIYVYNKEDGKGKRGNFVKNCKGKVKDTLNHFDFDISTFWVDDDIIVSVSRNYNFMVTKKIENDLIFFGLGS